MRGTQADRLTWDFFLEAFQKKYIGTMYIDARRLEFIWLKQGNRTVAEYEAEFLRLSWYAPDMVTTELDKSLMFEAGLSYDIKLQIATF